ncbi:response regulator [Flavobacteriaceae bacterium AU392]|nr:response regulator [Flavobacteriaceae bacterium]RKM82897.1 response regulator [Flavobacteriaceae bacterium AU392]
MSRIKYYIFVFLVSIASHHYAQNNSGQDSALNKNTIENSINKAELEIQNGNLFDAGSTLRNALINAETIDDKKLQGIIQSKIAKLQYLIEDNDKAKITIIKAINIQRELNDKNNLAISRYISGLIHLKIKEYVTALDLFKSAKTIFEEENRNEFIAEIALNQAICHIELNNLSSASFFIDESISLARKHNIPKVESAALIKNGIVTSKEENYNKALFLTQEGLEKARQIGSLELINDGYKALSDIYTLQENYQEANINLRHYIAINDSIQTIRKETLSPEKNAQSLLNDRDALINKLEAEGLEQKKEDNLSQLTTILSVALITILSLLTLSLYKNNNIRIKTNNMLYRKNDELLTEKERAEIAAKTKTNFLSTVTHELRTPLYAVTGLTNMLLEENPKKEQIQHLKSLKFSGDYLLTFINDILQINKIEANKVELDPEIFNLKHKVENVISALNNSALDNNTMIHFEYDKHLPETFNGDQLKISQILINLIGNSIKFTKNGDIWAKVTLVSKNKSMHNVRLEIKDNGIGITKEKQDNMFESFSQGSVQINRKYGGTGLGLSIVKGLVDILKGKIYLKSELGKGTSFFIEFPLEEAKELAIPVKKDYSKSISDLDLGKVKILVVEDNKINQMITKKILTKMGINCELVDNGEDAVEKVKEIKYDVVLMDIHMPGISGLEATKRIRAFNKELTIFALTAVTLEDKMQEFDDAGFNDIISKPFKQEDFEKKLYEALSGGASSISA